MKRISQKRKKSYILYICLLIIFICNLLGFVSYISKINSGPHIRPSGTGTGGGTGTGTGGTGNNKYIPSTGHWLGIWIMVFIVGSISAYSLYLILIDNRGLGGNF